MSIYDIKIIFFNIIPKIYILRNILIILKCHDSEEY